jgi:hypothetical protein
MVQERNSILYHDSGSFLLSEKNTVHLLVWMLGGMKEDLEISLF